MAPKLIPQASADWKYEYVLPQAVIVPGDATPMKLEGADSNVTDCSSGGAVVEDEVWVIDWDVCVVADVWVTDRVVCVMYSEYVCVVDWDTVVIVVLAAPWGVKSSSAFVPVSVIVWVIGPNPFPEAVTVMVPEVGIGKAYPPDEDETA